MAVEDKYVDTAVAAGKPGVAAYVQGKQPKLIRKTFEVAAADDNGSIYRVVPNFNISNIIKSIRIYNDAITSGTDYGVGLYQPLSRGGAVVNKDLFAAGLDMSVAASVASPKNGAADINIDSIDDPVYTQAGIALADIKGGYDIALTADTVGTIAGTITVDVEYIEGF
jgi:hypothetical protein